MKRDFDEIENTKCRGCFEIQSNSNGFEALMMSEEEDRNRDEDDDNDEIEMPSGIDTTFKRQRMNHLRPISPVRSNKYARLFEPITAPKSTPPPSSPVNVFSKQIDDSDFCYVRRFKGRFTDDGVWKHQKTRAQAIFFVYNTQRIHINEPCVAVPLEPAGAMFFLVPLRGDKPEEIAEEFLSKSFSKILRLGLKQLREFYGDDQALAPVTLDFLNDDSYEKFEQDSTYRIHEVSGISRERIPTSERYPLASEVVGFNTAEEMMPLKTMTIFDILHSETA